MPGWLKALLIAAAVVVLLTVAIIGVLIGGAVIGFKAAQKAGNEAATLQDLKTIAVGEIQYFNTHKRAFGTFDQLIKDMNFDTRFSGNSPVADGYTFTLKLKPKTPSGPASYKLNADPQTDSTGKNHFFIDSTSGTIHVNSTQPASATDPPLGG